MKPALNIGRRMSGDPRPISGKLGLPGERLRCHWQVCSILQAEIVSED